MKKRISATYCGLALLIAAPSAFALAAPHSLNIDPSSLVLLSSGLAGIFAIRLRER